MANPASDYPASIHTNVDTSAYADEFLGETVPTHTEVHGKLEEEITATQQKIGTGSSTPTANVALMGTGAGTTAWRALSKSDVGLSNVNNTSDIDKPVSDATQAALDLKANVSALGNYVLAAGDTMSGALVIATNTIPLYLGDTSNASVYTTFNDLAYVGYDAVGNAVLQGSTSKGIEFNVNNATFGAGTAMTLDTSGLLGIGVTPTASNGYLQLPTSTTLATGGIAWGTDTNLYRSAANTLKTDDALYVTGSITTGSFVSAINRYYLYNSGSNFPGLEAYASTDSGFVYHYFYRSRAGAAQTVTNDVLGAFGFRGHTGSAYMTQDSVRLSAAASENTGATYGGHLDVNQVTTGTSTSVLTWRFASGGVLQSRVTGTSGGLSFGTGGTQDTNLYRTAANTLRTDDGFIVSATSDAQVTTYTGSSPFTPKFQINANGAEASMLMFRYTNDVNPGRISFLKSRGTAYTDFTATTTSDLLGQFHFAGANGTTAAEAARIEVIATASGSGLTYQPGGVRIWTSAASGSTTNVAMYIDDSGYVGFGSSYGPTTKPAARITLSGGTTAAEGILFFTDTNLYRSAADTLKTDDTLVVALELEVDGNLNHDGTNVGLYGVAPVARATTGIAEAAFVENAGGVAVNDDSTFGGYTMRQVVQALQNIGILT